MSESKESRTSECDPHSDVESRHTTSGFVNGKRGRATRQRKKEKWEERRNYRLLLKNHDSEREREREK